MKKISSTIKNKVVILNLIVLCALNSNAQSLLPRFEIAYFTKSYININKGVANAYFDNDAPKKVNVEMYNNYGNFMFKTGLVFKYKDFELSNDATIFCNKAKCDQTSFVPILAIWDFKASYNIDKIKISIVHQCIHPIKSSFNYNETYGGYEGFSVSYGY